MKTNDDVLAEAKRLHALGFAILWLHPKSKRPTESGWTTGPRKEWAELKGSYKKGMNLGVRLGEPSKIGREYLAVVDVDIKSTDPKHKTEVARALREFIQPGTTPVVLSGRGNSSRHYYFISPKPVTPHKYKQSPDVVKVAMPSVKPSKKELAGLTPEEIAHGYRLRPAWEIAVMGDGQQVVLPPSVHPDSGRAYAWQTGIGEVKPAKLAAELMFTPVEEPSEIVIDKAAKGPVVKEPFTFTPIAVNLSKVKVSEKIKAMIADGTGVEDRSAILPMVSRALYGAGLTQGEVLSVLTDPETFLGRVGYDHAGGTKNRARAAYWVWKYTVKAVGKDIDGMFSAPMAEPSVLSFDAMGEELPDENGFYSRGTRGGLIPEYDLLLHHFEKQHPFKTISDMKALYAYNGSFYKYISPITIKAFAENNFLPKPSEKIRLEFLHKVFANNVVDREFFTETTEGKINFKNGVLDLNQEEWAQELSPHSPELGFRGALPYDYDPEAKCPVFDKWIDSIMLGDRTLVCILQEFMGYVVRGGEYNYHKALWLGGTGRNGKSTFIDLLKKLIGVGNYSTISVKALVSDKFASSDLDGKIANFSEETSPEELKDSGPFKNLTGDGDISAQKKYGDPFHFRNRAKLIMSYNQIPDLKDLSAGMLSRPLIVPFKKIIKEEEQDRKIKAKLYGELSGIFNFALEGWRRLEDQNNFTKSEASIKALGKLKTESCNVYQWAENYLEFTDQESDENGNKMNLVMPRDLYLAYAKKERYAYKSSEFFRRLNQHPEVRKRRKHDENKRFYWGLKIGH